MLRPFSIECFGCERVQARGQCGTRSEGGSYLNALLLLVAMGSGTAAAQEGLDTRAPVWRFGAFTALSATDNANAGSTNPQSGLGSEVGVDVHVNLPYRRVRGFADYTLIGAVTHVDETTNSHRSDLRAGLNAEVIESHAFLDVAATYGVQLGSVFGQPDRSLQVENDNRIDTATVTIAPSLRSRLGETGRIEARAVDSTTKTRGSSVGDVHSQAGTFLLDSGVRPRSLTWKGAAFGAIYDPDAGRRTTEAFVRGDLGWAFDSATVLSVVAGREGNDFETSRRVYNELYGLSLDYRPNERTHFYAEGLRRFFGTGHNVLLSHRLPHFALIATSSRSNSKPGLSLENSNAFGYGSAYDVLFLQLASTQPDPDLRRILVQDLLARNGVDPAQQVLPTIITSGVLLVATNTVSATWSGVRNTITLSISEGNSRRLGPLVSLPVDDDLRTEDRIDQAGVQVNWFRRLTPIDDLTASIAWSRSEGAVTLQSSKSRFAELQWSRKVSVQSTIAVNVSRHSFESIDSDYSVNVLSCEYRVRF